MVTQDPPKPNKRIFIIDNREHPDPDPSKSVDEIRQHYASFYEELNNAETTTQGRGEETLITFTKRTGTKG
ncbi:MAG: PRTRC system protein C [Dehalococcoidales bacterium]|nr:PRTRC system protein C [Dehalococcoidales bacterium]